MGDPSPRLSTWLLALGTWLIGWVAVGAQCGAFLGAAEGHAWRGALLGAGAATGLAVLSPFMHGGRRPLTDGLLGGLADMIEDHRRRAVRRRW